MGNWDLPDYEFTDEWWETCKFDGAPYYNSADSPGYYYLEHTNAAGAVPAKRKSNWMFMNPDNLPGSETYVDYSGNKTLAALYADDMVPLAVAYSAGLVKLFWQETHSVPIGEAVDNTSLSWAPGGDISWFGQTTASFYGGAAAQSGIINDSQSSGLLTTISGPGTITFWWKVSSEIRYDYLRFYINSTLCEQISGEVDWQFKTFSLSPGLNTLVWEYSKDDSVSSGSDCGWVDKVEITANIDNPPVLTSPGNKTVNESVLLSFTLSATDPDGDIITYSMIGTPTGSTLNASTGVFNWIPDYTQSGSYAVTFTATANGQSDSKSITITVNNMEPPASLVFVVQPTDTTVDAGFTVPVEVMVQDTFGNTILDATNEILITLVGTGVLGGTSNVNAINGIATFANLTVGGLATTGHKLRASSPGLGQVDSDAFTLTGYGTATKLIFITQPGFVISDYNFSPPVAVAITDAYGNIVETATGQITLAISAPASLDGTVAIPASNGVAEFIDITVNGSGAGFTLIAIATSGTLTSSVSNEFDIDISDSSNTWTTKANMPTARYGLTIGVVNNKIYVIGGSPYSATNEEYDPINNTWVTKASMPTGRYGFAIGVVNNKIYAFGGSGAPNALTANEEYNPETDSWISKTNMPTGRENLSAGVVNNKIYVIGGYNSGSIFATNEEYDPINNTWVTKASMPTGRHGFAIGVVNNKIYAMGGYNGDYLATNEEYDPTINAWTTKASMTAPRYELAIGVVNNKIYVIGGSPFSATNEEYDPINNTWVTKASMPTGRYGFAIGVVNNKIYAIGGYDGSELRVNEEYTPNTANLVTSTNIADGATDVPITTTLSWSASSNATSYDVYFNATITGWTAVTNTVLASFSPFVLSYGTVYYWRIDSINSVGTSYGNLWSFTTLFEPNSWRTRANMPTARAGLAIGVIDNKIYAIGGGNGINAVTTNEEYDPGTNSWATKTSMPTARYWLTIGVANNKLYAISGIGSSVTAANEEYDPGTNLWATKASIPTARQCPRAISVNNKIYCIGGYVSTWAGINEVYDAVSNTWLAKASMPTPRTGFAIGVVNNEIYCIGGWNNGPVNTNEKYIPVSDTWTTKANMPTARGAVAGGVINNKIYAIGGTSDNATGLGINEEYDPNTNAWVTKASMPTARFWQEIGAVNGKIYAIGGMPGNSVVFNVNEEYTPDTPPSIPELLAPADGAVNVPITTTLSWSASTLATSYDIYFGTTTTGWTPITNTVLTSFSPSVLSYNTLYYWRVDAKNPAGTTWGNVWSFQTMVFVDNPPVLISPGNKSINEGALLTFTLSATDPDGDVIIYSMNSISSLVGASLSPSSGVFFWTPTYAQSGNYNITFYAMANGRVDSKTITITVNNIDRMPVLVSPGNKSVNENSLLTFTLEATDIDGDTITYAISPTLIGVSLKPFTGLFSWTPTFSQSGIYNVTFTASANGQSDSKAITITVNNVDRPPILSAIGDKTASEGTTLSFTISATDLDGDVIAYSMVGTPTGAALSSSTGVFSWTPDYTQSGSYVVTFTVTANGLSDYEEITIAVNNVDRPPVLATIDDRTIDEGTTFSFVLSASDADGDMITYSMVGTPTGSALNSLTGAFNWTPDYTQSGSYVVTFTATANGLFDSKAATIVINNVDRPLVLATIDDKTIDEGTPLTFTLLATDPDSDAIAYSMAGTPTGASLNSSTGVFNWTPDYVQAGNFVVTFTATANTSIDSKTATITVNNVDRAPVLTSPGDWSVNENVLLTFTLSATDADGDTITYSMVGTPTGSTLNASTGIFNWTPDLTQSGSYAVTFTAMANLLLDAEAITITVNNNDRMPVLVSPGNKAMDENKLLTFVLSATDPDGDTITYSMVSSPNATGAVLNPSNGLFSWTTNYAQSGSYVVTFTATSNLLSDSKVITITVNDITLPNKVILFAPISGAINVPISISLTWTTAISATSYDVWLVGGNSSAPLQFKIKFFRQFNG